MNWAAECPAETTGCIQNLADQLHDHIHHSNSRYRNQRLMSWLTLFKALYCSSARGFGLLQQMAVKSLNAHMALCSVLKAEPCWNSPRNGICSSLSLHPTTPEGFQQRETRKNTGCSHTSIRLPKQRCEGQGYASIPPAEYTYTGQEKSCRNSIINMLKVQKHIKIEILFLHAVFYWHFLHLHESRE